VTTTGFPDLDIALDALVAELDLVAKRWTFRGTHTGDYMGLPASGRRADVPNDGRHRGRTRTS
jgi:predicted ester cyclase